MYVIQVCCYNYWNLLLDIRCVVLLFMYYEKDNIQMTIAIGNYTEGIKYVLYFQLLIDWWVYHAGCFYLYKKSFILPRYTFTYTWPITTDVYLIYHDRGTCKCICNIILKFYFVHCMEFTYMYVYETSCNPIVISVTLKYHFQKSRAVTQTFWMT